MKQSREIMGMPVSVEIADASAKPSDFAYVFGYLEHIDETFSTYKETSEISRINRGEIRPEGYSDEVQEVFALSEETCRETGGYFDIRKADGSIDPSGLVKGWAINNAAKMLHELGLKHFFVDIGGDVATSGKDPSGADWAIGIRSPFDRDQIIKVVYPKGGGIATSGTYIRGEHIYEPHTGRAVETDIVSLTVIGPDVYEADRFATAAFAMGRQGIAFIEKKEGLEGYAVDRGGMATMTSGFDRYTTV